ncbi:nuclear transport factor 2 family protein [Micromonospora sp. WMMD961]|uniref:nuclear transport factor 2 family protein n=1 Tax=Micromonospora sp. WMMD961 TaxID=3016100 RepID=UPI002415DA41|nr:nuclear transport factor 2 family protein [Micromonospora sp. WMMD961]MDG4780330.1 nuclear transport factor 2 family protein [Micromonospora sp. WMMD961]
MSDNPAAVFHRGMELLLAKDMAGFIALFAEDAVLELPFAPPGQPRRVAGRADLHEYLINYPDLLDVREIHDRTVHETRDPEVVVVEFVASGVVVASGRPYELRYIAVLTIRAGKLVHYRDYWDPIAAQELLGGGLVRS